MGFAFQSNLYLTPALSQGFDLHYDTHDVFVLQVHGRKNWSVRASPILSPLPGQTYDHCELDAGEELLGCTLNPGDLLYIPRGFYHSATSCEDVSLHITLGALTKTWADVLLERTALACVKDPALRQNLPVRLVSRAGGPDGDSLKAHFDELWQTVSQRVGFGEVLLQFEAEAIRQTRVSAIGHLKRVTQVPHLSGQSTVAARTIPIGWRTEDSSITVIAFEKEIAFPLDALEDLRELLLSGKEVKVQDLGGPTTADGKLVIVRRLVLEGLLDIVRLEA